MLDEVLTLVLQMILNQNRRRWMNLPVRILQNGHISLICRYGRRGGDANWEANPPYKPLARPFMWWVKGPTHRALILVGMWGQQFLICFVVRTTSSPTLNSTDQAWAIYYYSNSLLGKRQIGLCLSQARLHPFKSDLHNFICCLGQSTRHQRCKQNWVDAAFK